MRTLLLLPLLLAGCQSTTPEPPPPASSGLFESGPVTGVEHGPGSRSLYKDFLEAQTRLATQAEELEKLRRRLAETEDTLARITTERDATRANLAGAEAERDQARASLRERDLQLLTLALQKTRAETELLQTRLEALTAPPPTPQATPLEGL